MTSENPESSRRRLVAALAGVVLASGIGAAALQAGSASEQAAAPATTTTTDTTLPPTTNTTARPAQLAVATLRTPAAPPLDDYAIEPEVVVGSIEIPRLGLNVPLNQGISLSTIDRGPSHWPGTALPGETGNVVIAGHRVSKTRPFRHLDQLQPNDEVILTGEHGRFVYRVTASEVVTPDAMHIVEQTHEATATLFACHPPGSARFRFVVKLALEGTPLPPGGPMVVTPAS